MSNAIRIGVEIRVCCSDDIVVYLKRGIQAPIEVGASFEKSDGIM